MIRGSLAQKLVNAAEEAAKHRDHRLKHALLDGLDDIGRDFYGTH